MKTNTLILHTAALFIMPLQLMFSLFLLLRGHDEPGGGFIGGLVAASAFVLYALHSVRQPHAAFCGSTLGICCLRACSSPLHQRFPLFWLANRC